MCCAYTVKKMGYYRVEIILFIVCVYVCKSGYTESLWVGPVWGLDDRRGSYQYKAPKRNFQPIWIPTNENGDTPSENRYIRALPEGSKLTKFYCTVEKNMKCPMGGKGPTIVQKLSTKVAVCVCYCSSGFKEDNDKIYCAD